MFYVESGRKVTVGGGALPAVRVELNPMVLANYGIGLETVRAALGQVNSNQAKGRFDNGTLRWTLTDNDQLFGADHYRSIIVAYHKGSPVRLGDIATVLDALPNPPKRTSVWKPEEISAYRRSVLDALAGVHAGGAR